MPGAKKNSPRSDPEDVLRRIFGWEVLSHNTKRAPAPEMPVVQIIAQSEYFDSDTLRAGVLYICRDESNQQCAVRGIGARFHVDLQLKDGYQIDSDVVDKWAERLDSYVRFRIQKDDECPRTQCECGNSSPSPFVVSTEPCIKTQRAFFGTPGSVCDSWEVVLDYPLNGFRRSMCKFVRFKLSQPYFSNKAKTLLNKIIDELGWTLDCEVHSVVNDTRRAFSAYSRSLAQIPPATPELGASTLCCQRWIEFLEPPVPEARKITREPLEYVVDVHQMTLRADINKTTIRKRLALDIEIIIAPGDPFPTPETKPVFMIQTYNSITKQIHIFTYCYPPYNPKRYTYVQVANEAELLMRFRQHVIDEAPNYITGYNINAFDMPYLFKRAQINKLHDWSDFSRIKGTRCWMKSIDQVTRAYSRTVTHYYIPGIVVRDTMEVAKKNVSLPSYKLDDVALARLGTNKVDIPIKEMLAYLQGPPEKRDKFYEYGCTDVELDDKLNINFGSDLMYEMYASVFGVGADDMFTSGMQALLLSFAMNFCYTNHILIPSHRRVPKGFGQPEAKQDAADAADAQDKLKPKPDPKAETERDVNAEKLDDVIGRLTDIALDDAVAEVEGVAEQLAKTAIGTAAIKVASGPQEDEEEDEDDVQKKQNKANSVLRKMMEAAQQLVDGVKPGAKTDINEAAPQFVPLFYRIPGYEPNGGKYEGAYVMVPVPGYHVDGGVFMCDFASLYPSVATEKNLSNDTLVVGTLEEHGLTEDDVLVTATYGDRFVKKHIRPGIVGLMVTFLGKLRNIAKKELGVAKKNNDAQQNEFWDARQKGVKVAMNSIYGALGASNSWASCVFAARAITKYGQISIKRVRDYVEQEAEFWLDPKDPKADEYRAFVDHKGNKLIVQDAATGREKFNAMQRVVVYGDTDSIMTKFVVPGMVDENGKFNIALALKLNDQLVDEINKGETLPDGTRRPFYTEPMKLAAEAVAHPMIMTHTKKAYTAKIYTSVDPKDCKLKITGLANVRREYPKYTRDVLNYFVALALAGKPVREIYEAAKRCTSLLLGGEIVMESEEEAFERSEREEQEKRQAADQREAMLTAMTIEDKTEFLRKEKEERDKKKAEMIPDEPIEIHLRDLEMSKGLKKRYDVALKSKKDGYYANPLTHEHVHACIMWQASARHAATVPQFGDRVPFYFAMVVGATCEADRAVPPFMVRPGGRDDDEPPLALDRVHYFTSKYKNPVHKLISLLLAPEFVKDVLNVSNYKHSRRFASGTNETLWTQAVERPPPVVRRQTTLDGWGRAAKRADIEEI